MRWKNVLKGNHILILAMTFLLLLGAILNQSCSRSQSPSPAKVKTRIGISIPQTSELSKSAESMYTLMKRAIFEQKKEFKALKVEIVWKESKLLKNDMTPQELELQNLKAMLSEEEGIEALVYKPVDPNSTFAFLKEAKTYNVKVIALDELPFNLPVDGYITVNQADAGRIQAKYIVEKLEKLGKIGQSGQVIKVIVLENPTVQVAREVASGVYEIFDQYPDEIQPISLPLVSRENEAFKLVSDAIAKYAGNIQAVVSCQSELTLGAVKALQQLELDKDIISVGPKATKVTVELISSDKHDMEVDQMPYERAVIAITAAAKLAQSRSFQYDDIIKNGDVEVKVKYSPIKAITR